MLRFFPPRPFDNSKPETSDEDNVDTRKFECTHRGCKYRTNKRSNMTRHVNGMHGDIPTPRLCCGQEFGNRFAMEEHRNLMHRRGDSGPPIYKCEKCTKIFGRQGLLARHMCVHTGEKPFECNVCNYGTSHKSNLERHKAAKHDNVKAKPDGQPSNDKKSSLNEDSGIGTDKSAHSRPASAGGGDDVADQRGCTEAGPKRTPLSE
ncbi:zinc finger, C2H2 type, putative [Ixodes scapularis]|uniref:Zinc finger, C2H2 type, putative n=1 Tax=Ixodes scapularis TaxID=6945 RepID=B7PCN9_IXOSC|nr:zinc finger, C2H2 type, putative [Ixodes scapularis]|eukprot:XP_002410071.1 zinc finger, C2H2 type, putative [Ixodes scapularis]